jgi:hypothetical protein
MPRGTDQEDGSNAPEAAAMSQPVPFVILHHGTTLKRAERIVKSGPGPRYVEPCGSFHNPAEAFSTGFPGVPDIGLKTPEDYARMKAGNFPGEGGAVILEIEVPEWIVDIVRNDWILGPAAKTNEVRFCPGYGLEELLRAWPTLTMRVLPE